jgi:prepilin-type N-terminal cleavage/methylation domain-containing protein
MRRARAGFTLIELMIVVVIIGILVAIVIPNFFNTKDKAYAATLHADIHNFAAAEEAYFVDQGAYTDDVTLGFTPSPGNAVLMGVFNAGGWSASIYSQQDTRVYHCGMRIGNVAPQDPKILTESQVYCFVP